MNFRIMCLLALLVSSECASLFQAKNLTKPQTIKIKFRMINDSEGGLKLLPLDVENFENKDNEISKPNREVTSGSFEFPERFESISQVGLDTSPNSIDGQIDDMSDEESEKPYNVPNYKMYQ